MPPAPDPALDPVAVLRDALATTVHTLATLDEHAPGALFAARRLLATLADRLAPTGDRLAALAATEPHGGLVMALDFLRHAVNHLDAGDLAAGRAAVVTAYVTLASVAPAADLGARQPDWRM
jgi:hypothetical protein